MTINSEFAGVLKPAIKTDIDNVESMTIRELYARLRELNKSKGYPID